MTEPSKWAHDLVIRIRERYKAPGNEHVMELNEAALELDRTLDAARREALLTAAEQIRAAVLRGGVYSVDLVSIVWTWHSITLNKSSAPSSKRK